MRSYIFPNFNLIFSYFTLERGKKPTKHFQVARESLNFICITQRYLSIYHSNGSDNDYDSSDNDNDLY